MSGLLQSPLALALLLAGCGVGRAVVGEHGLGSSEQGCKLALPCKPLTLFEPEDVPDIAAAIDLAECAQARDALCSGAATTPSGQAVAQCSAPSVGAERTFASSGDLGRLGCGAWRLVHTAASGEQAVARIELEAWQQVQIEVESDEPAALELTGGSMEQVFLALRGPIALRVLDSEQIADLRISADGAAQIELTRTRAAKVSIAAPRADVLLRRSSLDQLRLSARHLGLESSSITDADWQAESLNATDTTLARVRSEVERSVLSACDAWMTSFTGCRSWTSVQGHLSDVKLSACTDEVSVYGSAIARGHVDGDLLLDGASLSSVVLGLGAVGAISTWDTQLNDITFCADGQALSLGGASTARCAHCDRASEPVTPDACVLERSHARVEDSESCQMLDRPPPCAEPQAERMRPPRM